MSEEHPGLTDLHSHLVPHVDDGARTLEEALEGVGRLRAAGVLAVATTPHLDGSLTQEPEALEARLSLVEEGWRHLGAEAGAVYPEVRLFLGHEIMLDVPDPDLSHPRLRLGGTSFALLEWPRLQVPPGSVRVLSRLREEGVRPVVAHPERYHGLGTGVRLPGEWKRVGAYLQVNYGSLCGQYGPVVRDRALAFLERGWVELLSSDFHGRPHLSLHLEEARQALAEMEGGELFDLLARVNPARVLRDEEPLPALPLQKRAGPFERLRRFLSRTPSRRRSR